MSDINHAGSDLIFELEDRPPFHQALVGAITHLLAIFVPMVRPYSFPLKQLPILFLWR